VPEFSAFAFKMVITNFKRYKAPGIDQILTELIKTDKNL
jgi:hypothetical protein